MDSSRLRLLRWIGVVAPAAFIALLTYIAYFRLSSFFPAEVVFTLIVGVTTIGAFLFSTFIFSQIEKRELEILRRSYELATLQTISEVVSGSLELDEILTRSLKKVMEVTDTEVAEVFLLDEATKTLTLAIHDGAFSEAFQEFTRFPLGEGLPGSVAISGQAVLLHNLASDPRFIRQKVKTLGFQSYACVPLRAKDRVVGVIDVADRRTRLTTDDLQLLTAIGNQVGIAIDNAQLYAHVQQTADYLNALIQSSGDAMITIGLNGEIISWNRGAEEIYGWSKDEAIGQVLPMVPPDGQAEAQSLIERLKAGEVVRNFGVVRRRKDGQLLEALVTASPLCDAAGQIAGFLGISKDISELKRLERALLAQGQSLAILEERDRISMDLHDGVIQALYSVGLRLESCLPLVASAPEEVGQRLERVTDDVTNIIKQIRDYVFDLRTHHLHGRSLTEGLTELAQELKINTIMPVEVIADDAAVDASEQLSEAQATNLFFIAREALTNILKHARASEASIQLSVSGSTLYFTVKDNGIGFDRKMEHVYSGNGLRNIAERAKLLGAYLNVNSHPGSNTEIRLEIPLIPEVHNG